MQKHQKEFKKKLHNYLGLSPDNISLFWKGRVALYAILKAIDIKEGDEIILPAFTCVVVANAIIYLGAKPVYVDIDPKTYNIDIDKVEEKITSKTKAILAQNTFGLSSDLEPIMEIAKKYNIFVIEDCAHGFGGSYKGKLNGTITDAAFYSSQWNKPFSTGLGGIAVTNNPEIALKLKEIENKALKPVIKEELALSSLVNFRDIFSNQHTYWVITNGYRFLSQNNIILGSSQGEEIKKPEITDGFLKGFSNFQAKRGLKELKNFDMNLGHRRKTAQLYKKMLENLDIPSPYEPEYAVHTYIKYPVLVKNREEFLEEAQKNKIEFGDWFISPLHPIIKNYELWNYKYGDNPIAEKISQHIVNLPTHLRINEDYVAKIEKFLIKYRDYIIDYR